VSEEEKLGEIALENGVFKTRVTRKFQNRKVYEKQDPRTIRAVIPGVVAAIEVSVGRAVMRGDTLLILEAMKMLNRIKAPVDGSVKTVSVVRGEKVAKGQVLIEIE
jgi:biotin carboxyl carrier protein